MTAPLYYETARNILGDKAPDATLEALAAALQRAAEEWAAGYNVRDAKRIQRAHDVIAALVESKVLYDRFPANHKERLVAVHNCLCWILEHSSGDTFAENVQMGEEILRHAGAVEIDMSKHNGRVQ
jgi:tRNA A37 N6-isopentenylltransferase MiaA